MKESGVHTSNKHLGRLKAALLVVAAISPGIAFAGAWSLAGVPSNAPVGGGVANPVVQVQFAGDGSTFDAQTALTIPAGFTATVAPANGGGCQVVGTQVNVTSSTAVLIPAGPTTFCNITYTALAATAAGSYNITTAAAPATGCFDSGGNVVAVCTPIANGTGALAVVAGPSAPTVGPLAALTLPAGPINLTATGNVPVSITGTGVAPASLALSCSIPATGASAFAITSGGTQTINAPATVGPGTPIGVSCVRGAADVTATLTCTQTATPTAMLPNLTAAITCPAGTVAPNPGSSPVAPGPITLIGAPGATATGSVTFTNAGGTAAYQVTACAPSAGYATPTVFPVNVAAGATGAVAVTCTTPAASGTSGAPGTLACTTSAAGFNPTFNVTCTAQSASIPTLGFGGKALMVLLMLGFGLVGFQLYRRSA
jgi:hypothetical protein